MVKHVILWDLKDEIEDKCAAKRKIKEGLEGLKGKIPGLIEINVHIDALQSSNAELSLDSLFESEEALKAYSIHPEHGKVADEIVRPRTKNRRCIDYEI